MHHQQSWVPFTTERPSPGVYVIEYKGSFSLWGEGTWPVDLFDCDVAVAVMYRLPDTQQEQSYSHRPSDLVHISYHKETLGKALDDLNRTRAALSSCWRVAEGQGVAKGMDSEARLKHIARIAKKEAPPRLLRGLEESE